MKKNKISSKKQGIIDIEEQSCLEEYERAKKNHFEQDFLTENDLNSEISRLEEEVSQLKLEDKKKQSYIQVLEERLRILEFQSQINFENRQKERKRYELKSEFIEKQPSIANLLEQNEKLNKKIECLNKQKQMVKKNFAGLLDQYLLRTSPWVEGNSNERLRSLESQLMRFKAQYSALHKSYKEMEGCLRKQRKKMIFLQKQNEKIASHLTLLTMSQEDKDEKK